VIATAKRARQLISGAEPLIDKEFPKPLSMAIEELYQGKVKIVADDNINKEYLQ
jgi:DNA-directed RNA polymerase subunit omega